MEKTKTSGFTLVELLVVISIISLLMAFSVTAALSGKAKAQVSRAKTDTINIKNAIALLNTDTGQDPLHQNPNVCGVDLANNEGYVTAAGMGLLVNDSATPYPNWKGPYIAQLPKDPWGQDYMFDGDYTCDPSFSACKGLPVGTIIEVVYSGGPNRSGVNVYDGDNVATALCTQ
jgi:general secretion pathway protein G